MLITDSFPVMYALAVYLAIVPKLKPIPDPHPSYETANFIN